jgi:hypothetical protein
MTHKETGRTSARPKRPAKTDSFSKDADAEKAFHTKFDRLFRPLSCTQESLAIKPDIDRTMPKEIRDARRRSEAAELEKRLVPLEMEQRANRERLTKLNEKLEALDRLATRILQQREAEKISRCGTRIPPDESALSVGAELRRASVDLERGLNMHVENPK